LTNRLATDTAPDEGTTVGPPLPQLTGSGKIQRFALRDQWIEGCFADAALT
jgi:hypothetical protein